MDIEVTTAADKEDLKAISNGIESYNTQHIGQVATEKDFAFAVFARNEAGNVVGGIRAVAFWNWLHIEQLWLEEEVRGTGTGKELLSKAEEFAMENGLFLSRLETTGFQAREFYEKQGYEVFGTLDDLPKGFNSYFMKKTLRENELAI